METLSTKRKPSRQPSFRDPTDTVIFVHGFRLVDRISKDLEHDVIIAVCGFRLVDRVYTDAKQVLTRSH